MFTLGKLTQSQCDVKHYGQHMCSSLTICLYLSDQNPRYLVYCRKELETRVLPWQYLNGGHLVAYLMYIIVAEFEYHYSNIL